MVDIVPAGIIIFPTDQIEDPSLEAFLPDRQIDDMVFFPCPYRVYQYVK
jgi:hypothetical protein